MYEISFLERFQLLAVVSLPQCAFAHFGAGVKASPLFSFGNVITMKL